MFAHRLYELRNQLGYSRQELAKLLGVSLSTISNYENDIRKPDNNDMWRKLASVFDISVDYLMGEEISNLSEKDIESLKKKGLLPSSYKNDTSPSPHIIAANTGSIDGNPIPVLSKPENIIRNPKKDILIKLIQEGDIPDSTLDLMTVTLQQYKK